MTAAGVFTKEVDLSTRVPSFPGVYGAIVLPALKGEVSVPGFVTTDTQFLKNYTADSRIEVGMDLGYFSALNFLQKSNKLWVVRAAKQSKYAAASFRSFGSPYSPIAISAGLADPTAYVFDASPDVPAVAEVSTFTAVADVAANLASKYFTFNKVAGAFYGWFQVAIAAIAEVTNVTFSQAGSFYDVIGTAKALQFFDGAAAGHYFWFNVTDGSNSQTDPALLGTGHVVNILSADTSAQIAVKFAAVADALASFVVPVPGASIAVVTNAVAGVAVDATASGSAAAISVATQGAAATTSGTDPVQSGTAVMVSVNQNDSATAVASAVISALASHGAAAVSGQPTKFRITNAVAGSVADATIGNSGFTVVIDTQGVTAVTTVDESLLLYGANQGAWANSILVKITTYATNPDYVKLAGAFIIDVYKSTNLVVSVESFLCSRVVGAKDGYGRNIFVEDVLQSSAYIRAISNVAVAGSVAPKDVSVAFSLAGGDDGLAVTDAEMILAADTLLNKSEIPLTLIMDAGHATSNYQLELDTICQTRKDCVALLSTPYSAEVSASYVTDILTYRKTTLNLNSSYSALFTPHALVYDKFNDRKIYVSPDGYAGAAISFSAANFEIWFPPAGFKRGLINVTDLRRKFTQGEMDILYDAGVNPIRFAPGKGVAIWGQKTLRSIPSALDRLNVRLLLIVIEPAIEQSLEDFLFDFNDVATRSIAQGKIEDYMGEIKARRGVYDFQVVIDDSNNSPADIDNNIMNVDLYVKPTKSLEFIPFRVIITSTGISFSTAAQQV